MRKTINAAVAAALLGTMAMTDVAAFAGDRRDEVIAQYYREHPRDGDYQRWKQDRRSWSDEDYLRWYQTRRLSGFQTPEAAAIFGVGAGDTMPGFQVN